MMALLYGASVCLVAKDFVMALLYGACALSLVTGFCDDVALWGLFLRLVTEDFVMALLSGACALGQNKIKVEMS